MVYVEERGQGTETGFEPKLKTVRWPLVVLVDGAGQRSRDCGRQYKIAVPVHWWARRPLAKLRCKMSLPRRRRGTENYHWPLFHPNGRNINQEGL